MGQFDSKFDIGQAYDKYSKRVTNVSLLEEDPNANMPRGIQDYQHARKQGISNRGQKTDDPRQDARESVDQKLNKQLKSYQIGLKDRLQASPFSSIIDDEDFSGTGS